MRDLTLSEKSEVSGGAFPVLAVIGVVAAVAGVAVMIYDSGYEAGSDQAERDNNNDGCTPAG